jgi:protease I
LISPNAGKVKGWKHKEWGDEFPIDLTLEQAVAENYDALLLPGGVMNPDKLRRNPQALSFVRSFFAAGKPVAAICHGPWTLIDAGVVRGRKMTSYESIQTDLKNAGAKWSDEEVVVDNGLITSRKPSDIPAFNRKMIEEFGEGIHEIDPASVMQAGHGSDISSMPHA